MRHAGGGGPWQPGAGRGWRPAALASHGARWPLRKPEAAPEGPSQDPRRQGADHEFEFRPAGWRL